MSFDFGDIVKGLNRYYRGAQSELKSAKDKANWVWESLQGDFNPNRSVGQLGLDMGVCLIPGVDTVMDVRDLIANIIAIMRAPASGMAWFSLALTLVGFIPELGSAAKGIVKIVFVKMRPLIKHADELTNTGKMVKYVDEAFDASLADIVTYLRDPRVQTFLTKARIPDIVKLTAKMIRLAADKINPAELKKLFKEKAENVKATLKLLEPLLPSGAAKRIGEINDGITRILKEFNQRIDQYMEPLAAIMRRIAQRLDEMYWVARTQQLNKGWIAPLSEQGARRLIAKHKPKWVKTGKVVYNPLDADDFTSTSIYARGKKIGAPQLTRAEIQSFAAVASRPVKARPLRDGETLYRIIDPTSGTFRTSWVTEEIWKKINAADDPRAVWRGNLAIKPEWNQNGQYVKYTYNKARDGEIAVWEGPAAAQYVSDRGNASQGFLEGGYDQVVFHPADQIKGAKPDDFIASHFPDMVEGGVVPTGVRQKINDFRIEGPLETGWGYKDFEDQYDLIGLPNPGKEK